MNEAELIARDTRVSERVNLAAFLFCVAICVVLSFVLGAIYGDWLFGSA